jgi:hypothetical protein
MLAYTNPFIVSSTQKEYVLLVEKQISTNVSLFASIDTHIQPGGQTSGIGG